MQISEDTFSSLVSSVKDISSAAQNSACTAVNRFLTLRNWLIGYYIVEYEQNGNDRAKYGSNLLKNLEEAVNQKGLNVTLFGLSRLFYLLYPQVGEAVTLFLPSLSNQLPSGFNQLPSGESPAQPKDLRYGICATLSNEFKTPADTLVTKLSFSHIREILMINDSLERYFYETECIRCGWSVRELRRQIATNLFVRAGISRKPELLLEKSKESESPLSLSIKDPFTFEFLGLDAKDIVSESDLEQAIIDNLQMFLLELGKGFCFEARQKRIIIDDRYYFADLVFYNRILHCNVIVELKNDEFRYEYLGQLNAYVGYYKENELVEGDNPPVGILLCTKKGEKMVEYALSGLDNHLFVSSYMTALPDKKQLEDFLLRQDTGDARN